MGHLCVLFGVILDKKSPFLFQDLMPKLLTSCKYFIVLCNVYFSRKWNLMTCVAMQFKSTRALKSICWQRVRFYGHHLSRVGREEGMGHVLLENCKKNEIAKMCISLIWKRIYAVKKCAKWVHRELGVNYILKDNFIGT